MNKHYDKDYQGSINIWHQNILASAKVFSTRLGLAIVIASIIIKVA